MSRFTILLLLSAGCDRITQATVLVAEVHEVAGVVTVPGQPGPGPEKHVVELDRELPPERVLSPGCVGSPYDTIQGAIDAASAGDVIEVCPGTWLERLTIAGKSLTLRSRGGADVTVVDAGGLGRALDVTDGADVVVEGFTFRSGLAATGLGGNVRCDDSDLVIRESVLEGGVGYRGGGLGMGGCGGLVEDNTFRVNLATYRGGGLYLDGTVDLLRNTFEANVSDVDAGAAYVKEGYGLIQGNTVFRNGSEDDGGGIFVYKGAPWVDGNTFQDNVSEEEGGGLRIKSSEAMITGNTFIGNHADWRGGAMKVSHDESVISGNTYVENTSWGTGGAVLLFESASDVSLETFIDNVADDGGAIAIVEGWGGPRIVDSVFDGNEADNGAHLYIELVGETVELRRVDLVGGEAEEGGAVYATAGSDLDFRNVLFAGNLASEGGGALALDGVTGTLSNTVAIWNDAPDGSAMRVTNGLGLRVRNSVFRENTGGAAVHLASGSGPTFTYNDFSQNGVDFLGLPDAVGANGNVGFPPGFVDSAGGDFTLTGWSELVDAGAPGVHDVDGTRSDIGLYGGPGAY